MYSKLITSAFHVSAVIVLTWHGRQAYGESSSYSNANRGIFAFPREAALGGADIAFSADASPQCNPAAIALDSISRLDVSYAGYYDNALSTSMVSYAAQAPGNSGVGILLGYLYVPDIVITTGLDQDESGNPVWDPSRLRYTSASDVVASVLYGKQLISRRDFRFSAGGRLHGLRRKLPGDIGYGIGLDAGAVASIPRLNLRLSLVVDDVTTNYIYWNSSYNDLSLPSVRLGAGWRKDAPYFYGQFTIVYATPDVLGRDRVWLVWNGNDREIEMAEDGDMRDGLVSFAFLGHYGIEYLIRNSVALRGGFSAGRFSFGGGVRIFSSALCVDFCYTTSELAGSYAVSVGYRW